jgi:ABC-type multidrug transport system fused ATPase/permease subunit
VFNYLSKVLYVLSGAKSSLVLLLIVFVSSSVLEAIGIGLIGPFISIVSEPGSIHRKPFLAWIYIQTGVQSTSEFILIFGLFVVVIFCIKSVTYFIAQNYIYKFAFNQEGILISRLLNAYLRVPYTFHLSRNTAVLLKTIIIEVNRFVHFCMLPLLSSISNLVISCVLLLLLAKTNLLLLVMILGVLLPVFLVFHRFGSSFRQWGKTSSEMHQEMMRTINHSLGGLKETKVIGCESYFLQQLDEQILKHKEAVTLTFSVQVLPRILIEAAIVIFLVFYISISQIFLKQNFQEVTALLGVFAFASLRLIPSTSQFIQGMSMLRNSSYTLDIIYFDLKEIEKQRLQDELKIRSDIQHGNSISPEKSESVALSFIDQINLENITYHYSDTLEAAIKNIYLTIKKGESIALIGKSGAGKTTLVDIILGLLKIESGDILVDGVSIYSNLRNWQNLIGYIPQSIFLIDDTIERNIAFGVPDHLIDPEKLDKAIQAAQLTELIEQLPNGIKTSVGERGVRLSGGQRQRVGIARALYHDREILVLDEATAALDNETESMVTESIRALSGIKTMIIIAHRLTTVKHCDRVYMLEKGCIVESGTYQEVVGEQIFT